MCRLIHKPMVRDTARRGGLLEGMIDGSIPYSMTTNSGNPKAGDQRRPPQHSDTETNMVDFLIMSLLVMLCLEQNPVHLRWPTTGLEVVTSRTTNVVYDGRLFWAVG